MTLGLISLVLPFIMAILILDNYDSFTYNLYHLVEKVTGEEIVVRRNDEIGLKEVDAYSSIILSPGPGLPPEAGILLPLIKEYGHSKKILGVCLGHQAIGQAFGGNLKNLGQVLHGVEIPVNCVDEDVIFKGIPKSFNTGRYHSWVIDEVGFPEDLRITAIGEEGSIQALRHKELKIWGVQFHPESVMTPFGGQLLKNWLEQ
jgi:anthranilate synthase component II